MSHSKYVSDWREVGVPEENAYKQPRLVSETITIDAETSYPYIKLALLKAHLD